MTEGHVDILNLIGLDHSTFNNNGQDVTLDTKDENLHIRVFRRGGTITYRCGKSDMMWDAEDEQPKLNYT